MNRYSNRKATTEGNGKGTISTVEDSSILKKVPIIKDAFALGKLPSKGAISSITDAFIRVRSKAMRRKEKVHTLTLFKTINIQENGIKISLMEEDAKSLEMVLTMKDNLKTESKKVTGTTFVNQAYTKGTFPKGISTEKELLATQMEEHIKVNGRMAY